MGLETEYAIRYSGAGAAPGNGQIYDALIRAISSRVAARPGDGPSTRNQIFVENGGAFYYEHVPHCPEGGLVEGATPECRSPAQLLLYQKAQEALLLEALPLAQRDLRSRGFGGDIGLLKNGRDAEGHVYGAQENYEVEIARGGWLLLYRLGLVLLLPLILLQTLVSFLVQLFVGLVLVLLTLVALGTLFLPIRLKFVQALMKVTEADERELGRVFGRSQFWVSYGLSFPVLAPLSLLLRATAFRRVRSQAMAFFVSRPVLTGTGMVNEQGRYGLSEKGPAIRRILRASIRPDDRPIFDTGNLMKQASVPLNLRFAPLVRLFRPRQRLQLGLSDSNAAQEAEYLKIATSQLVLDMVEAGALEDAPRLCHPVRALEALIDDPTLSAAVPVRSSAKPWGQVEQKTGLEMQRYYLDRARAFVEDSPRASLEAKRTLELWQEALSALEEGRQEELVGRLDWVTKRFFLETCEQEAEKTFETEGDRARFLKTIDLRYHELGTGYFARLEARGLAPRLAEPEAVRQAMTEPPEGSPAWWRGTFIRSRRRSAVPVQVSWASAWIGSRLQGKVVDFRPRGQESSRGWPEPE